MNDLNTFKKIKWYKRLLYIVPAFIIFVSSCCFLIPKSKDISASAAFGGGGNVIGNDTMNYYTWTDGFQTIFVPYLPSVTAPNHNSGDYSLMFPLPSTIGANLATSFPYNFALGNEPTQVSYTQGTIGYDRDIFNNSGRAYNICQYQTTATLKGDYGDDSNPPTFISFDNFYALYQLYSLKSFAIIQEGISIIDLDLFFDSLCNYTFFESLPDMDSSFLDNSYFLFQCELMRIGASDSLQPWGSFTIRTSTFTSSNLEVTFDPYEEGSAGDLFPDEYFMSNGRYLAFMRSATLSFVSGNANTSNDDLFCLGIRLEPHHIWSDTRYLYSFDYTSFAPVVSGPIDPISWLVDITAVFFDTELYPGFTFGGVFFTIVMIICAVIFLKVFAGG